MEKNFRIIKSTVGKELGKDVESVDNEICYLQERIKEIKAQQKRFEVKVLKQEIKKKKIEGKIRKLTDKELNEPVNYVDEKSIYEWECKVGKILRLLTPKERVEYCEKWEIDIRKHYQENGIGYEYIKF